LSPIFPTKVLLTSLVDDLEVNRGYSCLPKRQHLEMRSLGERSWIAKPKVHESV